MFYNLPHNKLNLSSINIIQGKLKYWIIKNQYYMIHTITRIRCENTPFKLLFNQLLNSTSQCKLGQHNFEFRSVSKFYGRGSEAGHFTNWPQFFIMRLYSVRISDFTCAWGWSEGGKFSHFIISLSSAKSGEGGLISHFIPQADQITSQVGFPAEHLDLIHDNHYVGPVLATYIYL